MHGVCVYLHMYVCSWKDAVDGAGVKDPANKTTEVGSVHLMTQLVSMQAGWKLNLDVLQMEYATN